MLEIDRIYQGDCLEVMRDIPDSSINLILTDPPYYKVKNEAWDHQWDNPVNFISWIDELCAEWQRVLAPNGSLYVFASPQMAARVEIKIGEYFNVLNNIRWIKGNGWHKKAKKEDLRSYLSPWEACIFAEHPGSDNIVKGEAGYAAKCDELRGFVFEPIRAYLDNERKIAGVKKEDCNEALGFAKIPGGMASRHYFSSSQWRLPTKEHYQALQTLFNKGNEHEYLRREYEDLRREYEDLRREYEDLRREYEDLRRPFSVTQEVPYTDVWDFPTVSYYRGKHPCEKPIKMLLRIITASSRPGDTVLDCFGGSCKVADACIQTGRRYIVIEKDYEYCTTAQKRALLSIP